MEKRFIFKDLLFFSSLILIAALVILSMYMIDRQWLSMAEMQGTMREQAKDIRRLTGYLSALEKKLDHGMIAAASTQKSDAPPAVKAIADNAFNRAQKATLNSDYATGDWYTQSFGVSLKTITPLISQDAYANRVQAYVLETLIQRDPDTLGWKGLIAKSWQVSEDGLLYTFQLRRDVIFSDGIPLTAADVVFSFDFIMNDKIAAPRQRAFYDKIDKVVATNDHEVTFHFKEPYFNSLSLAGGMEILPKHFYSEYLNTPETFNQSKGLLIGSGPYQLKNATDWTPSLGFVELVKNTRYWGDVEPSFDGLLWKVIENDSARLTTFRNGDIDIYSARPNEYTTLQSDKNITDRTNTFEFMSPSAGYSYLGWNQQRGDKPTLFANPKIRVAMTYLTDRKKIIKEIMQGYAEVAMSPFNPRSKQHDPTLIERQFDLAKAQQLLKEAGFEHRDDSGILKNKSGQAFEFELVYFQDNDDTKKIVLFLKDAYAKAGIRLIPKPTEWSVMLELMDTRDYDAITLGWTSGIEIDIYQMFHSSQTKDGDNFVGFKNKLFDRYIEQARSTVIESVRMPLWQSAEKILYVQQPYTFLMRRQSLGFFDKRIKNTQQTAIGLNMGFTPVELYVPLSEQKYSH